MTNDYLKHRSEVAELTKRLVLCKYPDISENERRAWFLAGYLHDIGKEVIDRRHPGLLEKTDPLTEEEWDIIRTHTQFGCDMLKGSQRNEISFAAVAALEHHECWDGSGYMGKMELDISLQGRVTAVADVYSALCQERPYRKAWNKDLALNYMKLNSGILFDPVWVDALMIEKNGGE